MTGTSYHEDDNDHDDEIIENGSAINSYLYSLLKLDHNATEEEIHRSYRTLSTTFHPDKLPPKAFNDSVQQVFLEVKRAYEVLSDPVLRLTYDHYGEEGIALLRRLQMERKDHEARKEAAAGQPAQEDEGDDDDDDDDDDNDGEENAYNLYESLEKLLRNHNYVQAKYELQKFMQRHEYHQNLSEDNQVHLSLSMEFPPVLNLKKILWNGKQYLRYSQKRIQSIPAATDEDREYLRQRILQERRLIDYQFTKFKDSQQGEVGFTLSSTQPRNYSNAMTGCNPISPKWSMGMGASTTLIYPQVAAIRAMSGKNGHQEHHPVSFFINTAYQPISQTQINFTTNLSSDDSHQFVLGSAHTFVNQTACRWNITLLSKSPLATPLIFNFKTYRHLKDIGVATGAVSVGGDGEMLQWNAKWEAQYDQNHKVSAKVSTGILQGNSIEISYRMRLLRRWQSSLDEYLCLPKKVEITSMWGRVQKVTAMVTQEFNSLAHHPTLGFGMEHDISLGRWTWIWQFQYNGSTFRIPIPVVHIGSVGNPSVFYARKLYYAIYCLLFQSMIADLLHDPELEKSSQRNSETEVSSFNFRRKQGWNVSIKTKMEAERQLKLMEPVATKKCFLESQRKNGLVILQATYWYQAVREADLSTELLVLDATQQLQFWVYNGTLSRMSATKVPKSSWMGFYDLRTETNVNPTSTSRKWWNWSRLWRRSNNGQSPSHPVLAEPHLTIRYTNDGYVYELTVGDTEPFVLPCNDKAECLGDASFMK